MAREPYLKVYCGVHRGELKVTDEKDRTGKKIYFRILGYVLKLAFGAGIIGWLIHSHALQPQLIAQAFRSHSMVLLAAMGIYAVVVFCSGLRWFILLRAAGLKIGFARVFSLHMIGIFFTCLMPGGTGGDLVKGYYLFREAGSQRILGLFSLAMDRVIGLFGLLGIGALMSLLNYSFIAQQPLLRWSSLVYGAVFVGTIFVFLFFISPFSQPLILYLQRLRFAKKIITPLVEALQVYRACSGSLIVTFLLTMLLHIGLIGVFALSAYALDLHLPFLRHGFLGPTLTMINGLPIAPAGIGVGEAAGKVLYKMMGLAQGGGEILALYHVCVLSVSLFGAPFYFLFRPNKSKV